MHTIALCLLPFVLPSQTEPPTADVLTLDRAVALGIERWSHRTVLEARVAAAESEIIRHKTPENPVLAVSTEQIDQVGTEAEEHYLLVSQKFVTGGRRRLLAEAAIRDRASVLAANRQARLERIALIHQRFFQVLYHQRRIEDLAARARGADRIVEAIDAREKAGLVSGLDRRRLRIERAEIEAGLASERAALAGSGRLLAGLLGLDRLPRPVGDLLPDPPEPQSIREDHPVLRAHLARADAAVLEERAAARRLVGEITLEAGLKQTGLGGVTDRGFYLGARLPLPAFDRNKAARARARSEERIARGEHQASRDRLVRRFRAARTELVGLRDAAERYAADARPAAHELVEIALFAYEMGELAITELLIAYRTLEDVRLRVTDMSMIARERAVSLVAAGGDL